MTKASEPKVKDFMGEDYTKVIFSPDLSKFKMNNIDNDIVMLMSRRAYDIAASTSGVKVFLNGKRVPVSSFYSSMLLLLLNIFGSCFYFINSFAGEEFQGLC